MMPSKSWGVRAGGWQLTGQPHGLPTTGRGDRTWGQRWAGLGAPISAGHPGQGEHSRKGCVPGTGRTFQWCCREPGVVPKSRYLSRTVSLSRKSYPIRTARSGGEQTRTLSTCLACCLHGDPTPSGGFCDPGSDRPQSLPLLTGYLGPVRGLSAIACGPPCLCRASWRHGGASGCPRRGACVGVSS